MGQSVERRKRSNDRELQEDLVGEDSVASGNKHQVHQGVKALFVLQQTGKGRGARMDDAKTFD